MRTASIVAVLCACLALVDSRAEFRVGERLPQPTPSRPTRNPQASREIRRKARPPRTVSQLVCSLARSAVQLMRCLSNRSVASTLARFSATIT